MTKLLKNISNMNLRKYFVVFFCIVMLGSLSNTFIYQFIGSSVLDPIEFAESDGESETEEERDEFVAVEYSRTPNTLRNLSSIKGFYVVHVSIYLDITSPPPKYLQF